MKLYSVQYMRGVAAVLVLLAHSIEYPLSREHIGLLRLGALGVALFFVISGFIMVLICGDGPFDPIDFYRRRIQRIAPLYWVATLAVAVAAIAIPTAFKNTEFSMRQLVLSLLFVPHYRSDGEIAPLLKLGWTLNLEFFFYLCFGLLANLRAAHRVGALSLAFVSLSTMGIFFNFTDAVLHSYTLFDLVSFCIGMWVGLWTLHGGALRKEPGARLTAAVLSVVLIFLSFVIFPHVAFNPFITSAQALGSAGFLIVGLSLEDRLTRLRAFTLVGDASYSIYLAHMWFVGAAVLVVRHLAPAAPVGASILCALVSGGLAGVVMYVLVERPIIAAFHRRRFSFAVNPLDAFSTSVVSVSLTPDEPPPA